ncbi:MAG: chemotaxis protein CheC [Vulcanimicrobiota bacterium]
MKIDACSSDVLAEMVSIGVGHSAGLLQSLLDRHIELRIPKVELLSVQDLPAHIGLPVASVHLGFTGFLMGDAVMLFPRSSALRLAALLNQEPPDSPELDSLCDSTLTEVGNIVLNAIVGTISNLLHLHLDYQVPEYSENPLQDWLSRHQSQANLLLVNSIIRVEGQPIEAELMLCLDSDSAQKFLQPLRN